MTIERARASDIHAMAARSFSRSKLSYTRFHALAVQFRALEIICSGDPENAEKYRDNASFWQAEARKARSGS